MLALDHYLSFEKTPAMAYLNPEILHSAGYYELNYPIRCFFLLIIAAIQSLKIIQCFFKKISLWFINWYALYLTTISNPRKIKLFFITIVNRVLFIVEKGFFWRPNKIKETNIKLKIPQISLTLWNMSNPGLIVFIAVLTQID